MQKKWVGTWATAIQLVEECNMPPSPGIKNKVLRQTVKVSIGGDKLRVRFSNKYGKTNLEIKSAYIALSKGMDAIIDGTQYEILFNGNIDKTIMPGETICSDEMEYNLSKLTEVTITILFGDVPDELTGHPGSRTTSFIDDVERFKDITLNNSTLTEHWYVILGIDVFVDKESKAIVAFGDSITDGRGSTTDKQNRWTDNLAKRLLGSLKYQNISVLNKGIGGNALISPDGLGPTGFERFDRDVLKESGVKYLIVLEGVNDIGINDSRVLVEEVINIYNYFISGAHEKGIKVYGCTILPFGGSQYDSERNEIRREKINDWIRNSGRFDAVIDFDIELRDKNNNQRLDSIYDSGDFLHPNAFAYEKMADIIDLKLFDD